VTPGEVIGIRPEAIRAWVNLTAALDRLEAPPICQGVSRDAWTSDDKEDRVAAAAACLFSRCPVMALCLEYADLNSERWHVFGGVDFGDPKQRRARKENP
jgi:hypothetical protein